MCVRDRFLVLSLVLVAAGSAAAAQTLSTKAPARRVAAPPLMRDLHRMLPHDEDASFHVVGGDLDADGDLDLFVANDGSDALYLGAGAGVFERTEGRLPRHDERTVVVVLADVDGDGDLDAVTGGSADHVLRNDGTARFTEVPGALPAGAGDTTDLALEDVDGDGALDLVVARLGGQVRLLLGNGDGTFADATASLPVDATPTSAVAVGDVDGDGDLDLLLGSPFDHVSCAGRQDRLWINDGAGVFSDATAQLPALLDGTADVALGDFTGDGALDALVTAELSPPCSSGQTRLYVNDGAGTFSVVLVGGSDHSGRVATGDVDGDGDLDAVVAVALHDTVFGPFGGGENRLYRNDGAGTLSAGVLPGDSDTSLGVLLSDVDGDLDLDLVVANGSQGSFELQTRANRLYLGDGAGSFADARYGLPGPDDRTYDVALSDLDGDGDADAFVVGGYSIPAPFPAPIVEQSRVLLNDGTGSFEPAPTPLPLLFDRIPTSVALGDVDGDGVLDALLGIPLDNFFFDVAQENRLLIGQGGGAFVDATVSLLPHFAPERGNTHDVLLRDVDGDMDLDAVLAKSDDHDGGGRGVWLFLNDGAGTFTDASSQVPLPGFADVYRVAAGDVDGDGDLDVVALGAAPFPDLRSLFLFLGDGTGTFADGSAQLPLPSGGLLATEIDLADVEGDGDLDLVASPGPGQVTYLFLNDGAGGFALAPERVPAGRAVTAFHDVDGDGDADLIGPDGLLVNTGRGWFVDESARIPPPPGNAEAFALGDLDGDGDADAFVARRGRNALWFGTARHVAWRGLPRVGKPLVVDVWGPRGTPWLLARAAGTASIVLPFGTLRLDPASIVVMGSGTLDGQGRASVQASVPPDPALVGATAWLQALVGATPVVTNLERATFLGL